MNYKKIALFFLLLFSSQEASSMQLPSNKYIIGSIGIIGAKIIYDLMVYTIKFTLNKICHYALTNRYSILARFLVAIGQTTTLLQHACDQMGYKYRTQYCNFRIENRPSQEDIDKECNMFMFLITSGVDPNLQFTHGSILKHACYYGNKDLIEKALQAGADGNDQKLKSVPIEKGFDGSQPLRKWITYLQASAGPLITAFLSNNDEIIKILAKHNAQPVNNDNYLAKGLLDPITLIKQKAYVLFNHLLDYTMQPTYSLCYTKYKLITCITKTKDIQEYISTILIAIMAHPSNFREYINNFIELQPKAFQAKLSSLINSHQQPTHYYKMIKTQTVYDEIILIRNRTNEFFPKNNFPIFNGCKVGQYRNKTDMYIKIFHTNEDEKDFNNKISSLDTINISTLLEEKYFDFSYGLPVKGAYNHY